MVGRAIATKNWTLRHTVAMRRELWLLVLGVVVAAALGATSASASDTGTTTTDTTTTTTTTPSYAPLPSSSLPSGCVGAGAVALVWGSRSVTALGAPGTSLGPSAYPASGSVVTFDSATSSASTCRSASVTVSSVSLFGGAVSASSVQATRGRGTVTGLEIDGSPVTAAAGQTLSVDGWGQLTLGATVGRVTAPLVLRLLQAHDSLPAGTAVAVAFAAAAQTIAKPSQQQGHTQQKQKHATGSSRSRASGQTPHSGKQRPAPDFPASGSPLLSSDDLPPDARRNPVVSLAMEYLGVPYTWGGASPKTGFDCSGLVTYVFAQLGVSLPHYAASQFYSADAVWVSPHRLEPGDLVFFVGSDGTRKEPGHVGIYVGDGYLIDAPHTGSFVRIDSLKERWFTDKYVAAKRIISPLRHVRHLLHATKSGTSARGGFPLRLSLEPLDESLGIASAGSATVPGASRGHWAWAGLAAGVGLLLLLSGGSLVVRRRSD
jgi:cell wall-associated NlpC family hydrolase